ncbi:putative reverse transcriptase domain-containing protein [Tanacetum coccineum]|uniref:Reverse transcriptase domain-containing protein n=1 Tax=Tanacetum coccineum TaxID=301880 RepID=A0ABQ5AC88_9ASTR
MLTITLIGSSASLAYSIFLEFLKTQSCFEFFPLLLPEPQKDGWTDSPQELSIPGISSKRPLSKGIDASHLTAKQLEDIHNFTQEGDESLYQAWERYNDMLYKCPTHDINSHQKTMADHSQKWHDGTTSKNIVSRISNDGLADLVNKLDKTGTRHEEAKGKCSCNPGWMPNLLKTSPRLRIALIRGKKIKEVRHGEYGQTTPFNGNNEGKFRVGPPGYYTKTDNRPPYGERRQSLEELLAKHQEESARRSTLGIVENVPVKIDEFLFPSDFVIIDNTPSETTILGRPFLDTIHAEIDVFVGKFSLRINEDRISFDTMRKDHNYTNPSEKNFMVNSGLSNRPQSPTQSNNQIDYEESGNWDNRSPNLEHEEMGIEDEDYHPPEVQVETFEVKKYSFEGLVLLLIGRGMRANKSWPFNLSPCPLLLEIGGIATMAYFMGSRDSGGGGERFDLGGFG